MIPCHFDGCPFEASVAVHLPHGCICYPDDIVQLLCLQHAHNSTPLD